MTLSVSLSSARHSYNLVGDDRQRPTLAFVHGWMLSRHYWDPLCQCLAPEFNCLTYDLRGFGESELGQIGSFNAMSYARDLLELLERLELDNVWVVGHSMGGSIALWAADLDSDRIAGAICVNAGGGIYLKEEFERFRTAGEQLIRFRPAWLSRLPGLSWYFCRDNVVQPLDRQWGERRLQDFFGADCIAARGSLLDSTTETEVHQLPQVVERLAQPVYFFAGDRDTVMEPKYVHHLASFHPRYHQEQIVFELPNCGHLAMLEQTDLLAQNITSLVTQSSKQSSEGK